MVKVENISLVGLKPALRGMRNPKNSWHRSDTNFMPSLDYGLRMKTELGSDNENDIVIETDACTNVIGPNDLDLCRRLMIGGPVHRKYLRMIVVYMDLSAPMDFWKEYDTYKVGTVANSCSTMHKIHEIKNFELDQFSCSGLSFDQETKFKEKLIPVLNEFLHDEYATNDDKTRVLSKILPQGWIQKRTIELNFEVLASMYTWRKNHKLKEWNWFINEIVSKIPHFEEICISVIKEHPNWENLQINPYNEGEE